jgi:hypothetical protein
MTKAEKYVKAHLAAELAEVLALPISAVQNGLTVYEKTLIYHYTKDGYAAINAALRKSRKTVLTNLLGQALKKLPEYRDQVFRTAYLSSRQLSAYQRAFRDDLPMTERSFLSSSMASGLARQLPPHNVRFQIASRSGRSVETVSHLGIYSISNEEEVLFPPGCQFRVQAVTQMKNYVLIILEEI